LAVSVVAVLVVKAELLLAQDQNAQEVMELLILVVAQVDQVGLETALERVVTADQVSV
jgi:hypothetical protein